VQYYRVAATSQPKPKLLGFPHHLQCFERLFPSVYFRIPAPLLLGPQLPNLPLPPRQAYLRQGVGAANFEMTDDELVSGPNSASLLVAFVASDAVAGETAVEQIASVQQSWPFACC
jgi:hypothetical protein